VNSSTVDKLHALARIPPARAKLFLQELANLSDDLAATRRLKARFPDIVPGRAWWVDQQQKKLEEMYHVKLAGDAVDGELHWKHLLEIRDGLRLIWVEPDLRRREWLVFRLRDHVMARADPQFIHAVGVITSESPIKQLPPPSRFEQATMYLFKSADRTRYCGNPDCPAPYFLAKRRSQKYCSDNCALPAQREFKRRWWAEHGKRWRKARTVSAKKFRRKRGK
jgi:hypothetical protein